MRGDFYPGFAKTINAERQLDNFAARLRTNTCLLLANRDWTAKKDVFGIKDLVFLPKNESLKVFLPK